MPAPTSTVTRLAAFYKTVFIDNAKAMQNMAFRDTPLFTMMDKVDDLDGASLYIPLNTNTPVGMAHDFTTARANRQGSKGYGFTLNRNTLYGFISVSGEAIHASRRNEAAFIRAREKESREAVQWMVQGLGDIAWGDGAADRGKVLTVTATTTPTIVLTDITRSINFQEGMLLVANTARTGAGTARAQVVTITSVNFQTGTVLGTCASACDWAVSDFIFVSGDRDQSTNIRRAGQGISAYIPASDPGSGGVPLALNGITDRSVNPVTLAGWRGTWEGTIEESVKKLAAQMFRYNPSGKATAYMVSFDNFFRLEMEMGARAIRNVGEPAKFGFQTIGVQTARGLIPVVADPYCPNDTGFLLDMSTWQLHSLREIPHVIDDDGRGILRETDSDGVEVRLRAWYEFVCTRPIANGRHPIV